MRRLRLSHSAENNRRHIDMRDVTSSAVVIDLFMNAQPTLEHGRPRMLPKLALNATGRDAPVEGQTQAWRCTYARSRMGSYYR